MKNILSAFAIFFIFSCASINLAQSNTSSPEDEKLLAATLVFVKQVKEFGKTIGIEPSNVLTKTTADMPPKSKIVIYLQKKRTLAMKTKIDEYMSFEISKPASQVPIVHSVLSTEYYSAFYRQVNESATEDMPITIDFAKSSALRRAEVVLHEDLHMNTTILWDSENVESLVTPLAYLAAAHFFKTNHDTANEKETTYLIEYLRKISIEINDIAKTATDIYNSEFSHLDAQIEIVRIIDSKQFYSKRFWNSLNGQPAYEALEALISMDLLYLKYFDKIVSLYEKANDITIFINDIKKAPGKTEDLENYFNILEQKYSGN